MLFPRFAHPVPQRSAGRRDSGSQPGWGDNSDQSLTQDLVQPPPSSFWRRGTSWEPFLSPVFALLWLWGRLRHSPQHFLYWGLWIAAGKVIPAGAGMSLGDPALLSVCVSTGPVEECRVLEVGSHGFSYASCLQTLPFICRYSKGTASVSYLSIASTARTPRGPSWGGGQGWGGPVPALKGSHAKPAAKPSCKTLLQLPALSQGFGSSPAEQWWYTFHGLWMQCCGVPPNPGISRLVGQRSMGRGRKGVLNCLSRWDLGLKIKYSCEVSLSCLSCRLSHHLRTIAQALNMACANHAVGHYSSGSGSGLSPDAYWQLKRAQLESSHSLASRVNTLAVRTVVSPAAPAVTTGTWSRRELLGGTG